MADQEPPADPQPKPDHYAEVLANLDSKLDTLTRTTGERMAHIEGRLEAPPSAPAPEPEKPKELTRAELRAQVEDGQLTQDQMDEILDFRREKRLTEKMEQSLRAHDEAQARQAAATAALAPYLERFPDIRTEGSENRAKVTAECSRLVNELGLPYCKATEAQACQNVFGPAKNLAERKRETPQEAGSGAGEEPAGERPVDAANKIPAQYREHYKHMIEIGQYTGWDDPKLKAEMSYMKGVK